jgi:hypothetical protein
MGAGVFPSPPCPTKLLLKWELYSPLTPLVISLPRGREPA